MNPPIPTPKLVPAHIAHVNGFLETTNGTRVVIEHTIPRGKRVDWRATAESLGQQLLDMRALYGAAEAEAGQLTRRLEVTLNNADRLQAKMRQDHEEDMELMQARLNEALRPWWRKLLDRFA